MSQLLPSQEREREEEGWRERKMEILFWLQLIHEHYYIYRYLKYIYLI